ncbi:MAG: hypothetical protein CO029_02445 [Candidatus Magasanikbacteria bacterium CG_4_9_14_0_2_um_filter_41_10]|uniref:Uncharacterized protein n=1 Tax=Candidatus Magasanikbacteria bacterium CG_4_10_14_0_2_um_filter_41_31 TaxID=1974639 RepID=A0A2M7V1S5_9BACT|nr:MAG: hypothetical protein COX83_04580 [Candidatus Magasanikbacteria bacterium CG_4_10_14_0_2_um_filter_41_31]PJC53505.1 MAG: hypothetical protein CO029_02445 [Candidatus Magasanikbacteria bacterium CG_4_9_14_0_2_um_filter_41_10]
MVCLWRGVWGLLDMYFFPHTPITSFTLSILLGMMIIGVTHYTIDKVV